MTDDLISRQAAIKALEETKQSDPFNRYEYQNIGIDWGIDAIKALPSAQPDIVACGDCIHWICHDRRCGYWNHGVKPLDWCCHAERRSDG